MAKVAAVIDEPSYPAVRFLVRYGPGTALAIPLAGVLGWLALMAGYGLPLWTLGAALFVALVLFGLLRSYIELVRIIADTLIPR